MVEFYINSAEHLDRVRVSFLNENTIGLVECDMIYYIVRNFLP